MVRPFHLMEYYKSSITQVKLLGHHSTMVILNNSGIDDLIRSYAIKLICYSLQYLVIW